MDTLITLWNAASDSTHYAALALIERIPGAIELIAGALKILGHRLYEDGTISR